MKRAEAASAIVAPLAASFLIGTIQIEGVSLVDFATFLFVVSTLLAVRIPRPTRQPTPRLDAARGGL